MPPGHSLLFLTENINAAVNSIYTESVNIVSVEVWNMTEIKAWDSVRRFWRILPNKLFLAGNKLETEKRKER